VSRNEQLNQQYEEMIDTIKSRAVWRVGEKLEEGETFRCECPKCGFESLHQRFDITRHRLLFGKPIRQMEAPRPMVRCRRCSQQRHLRDVGALVVPSTIALFDEIRTGAIEYLASQPAEGAALPVELDEKLAAFREESSGPIRQQLLTAIAESSPGTATTGAVADLGRALYLAADQIAAAAEPNN
jgi:hypothetical protein